MSSAQQFPLFCKRVVKGSIFHTFVNIYVRRLVIWNLMDGACMSITKVKLRKYLNADELFSLAHFLVLRK